jgi:uncharacterized protein YfbU (UPF0304 family)
MRKTKIFKEPNSYEKMTEWSEKNKDKFEIDIIFVENGYGIEYKPLKKIIFKSENDDDVSKMDNEDLALYLGISEQEVEDDRESAEEQARDLMNDPEQDF